MIRRFVILVLLVVCLRASASSKVPADVSAFMDDVQTALKKGVTDVNALSLDPKQLVWMNHRPRGLASWKTTAIAVPNHSGSPHYLAVFWDFHGVQSTGDHFHILVKNLEGWRIGDEIPERDTRGYRVRDHSLTVEYDLPANGCKITDDVQMERTSSSAGACMLRLSSDMQIDSITCGGKPIDIEAVPGLIVFTPPAAKTFSLHMAYHGTVMHPGSDYIRPTEAVLCSYWYPHVGRMPAKHGVTVTVPADWTAVGEGELVKLTEGVDKKTYTFRNEVPTCYFTLDAGPYKITSRQAGKRKLSIYELKPREGRAENALNILEKCLAFYDSSFGPMPYTHYEVVETLGPFGGALEAYSFSTYAVGTVPGAIPHEVAHTWWGGIVPNPYTSTLWNESFASYSDGLFHRQTADKKAAHAMSGQHPMPGRGRDLLRTYGEPIAHSYDTTHPVQGAVGYGKGSQVLAMLEDLIGTEPMIKSMRRFREEHKAGDAGDWAEFGRAVNKTTHTDYRWFFDQWVNRAGVPLVKLNNVRAAESNGEWRVSGEIFQESEPYRLKLTVALDVADGKRETKVVDVVGQMTKFEITAKTKPSAVLLDPEGNILLAGAKLDDPKADPLVVKID